MEVARLKYPRSKFWLIFWIIVFIPIGLILLSRLEVVSRTHHANLEILKGSGSGFISGLFYFFLLLFCCVS